MTLLCYTRSLDRLLFDTSLSVTCRGTHGHHLMCWACAVQSEAGDMAHRSDRSQGQEGADDWHVAHRSQRDWEEIAKEI